MSGKTARFASLAIGFTLLILSAGACGMQLRSEPVIPTIAFIPQTAGAMLWEVEHFGATVAAEKLKCHLYWNAPTSESDVAGQVSLIDRVGRGKYQGLVVAPNHPLAILASLRRAEAAGIPVVIVSSLLDAPAGGKLGYIVNDDEKMGEQAAAEIARLIHGAGSIAMVGLNRDAPGALTRARSAERFLTQRFPEIRVVARQGGAYSSARAEDVIEGTLASHPELKAVLSLTATSTRGAHAALKNKALQGTIPLVGCEQDTDLIAAVGNGEIAAILGENTYRMGYEAVGLISAFLAGRSLPARTVIPPLLITSQNLHSTEVNLFTSFPR